VKRSLKRVFHSVVLAVRKWVIQFVKGLKNSLSLIINLLFTSLK
jgi:hypothetical protein